VAGVVTDGGFRDSLGIRSTGLPCFQRETSGPATPIALHPVEFGRRSVARAWRCIPSTLSSATPKGSFSLLAILADEVADEAFDAVQYEVFVAAHLRRGRSIFGLFPATPESKSNTTAWWPRAANPWTRTGRNNNGEPARCFEYEIA
jgi:hypothetical protein